MIFSCIFKDDFNLDVSAAAMLPTSNYTLVCGEVSCPEHSECRISDGNPAKCFCNSGYSKIGHVCEGS